MKRESFIIVSKNVGVFRLQSNNQVDACGAVQILNTIIIKLILPFA